MGIGLMANIPDQFIDGCLINVMQGNGKFDHAETRAKVTASLTHGVNQKVAQLVDQLIQLFGFQLA
tara:strand:- start:401 stop:598 length:198 start_codon:yes stop_codon:yes gene_type:complete